MRNVKIQLNRMRRSIVLVIAAACLAAVGGGGVPAIAQDGPPPATNIVVVDGENPGEVIITWDTVPGVSHYRVAHLNWDTDYQLALASRSGNWLQAFVYVDIDAANFVGDRATYILRRLEQGALHYFLVGTTNSLFGEPTWPVNPVWQPLTVADHTTEDTSPDTDTLEQVDTLEQMVQAVLVQIIVNDDGIAGGGTGLMVRSDGLAITNRSALGDAETVRIRRLTPSGVPAEFTGTVMGRDILSDLAVIRPDTRQTVTPLNWADPDEVAVGSEVTAWGYPPGDISGTSPNTTRGTVASGGHFGDAAGFGTNAVNAVNSGGPLIDAEGNVIGINVVTEDGGETFAIASSHVVGLLDALANGDPEGATYTGSRFGYGYSANIPAGWRLAAESADRAEFEHPERKAYFGIVAYDLSDEADITSAADPLEALADKRRAELVHQSEAGGWRLYEETSYEGPGSIDDPEYLLQYRWSRAPQHCTALDTEVIALSSSYPDSPYGFVAVGGSCEDALEIYGEPVQAILDSFTP